MFPLPNPRVYPRPQTTASSNGSAIPFRPLISTNLVLLLRPTHLFPRDRSIHHPTRNPPYPTSPRPQSNLLIRPGRPTRSIHIPQPLTYQHWKWLSWLAWRTSPALKAHRRQDPPTRLSRHRPHPRIHHPSRNSTEPNRRMLRYPKLCGQST